MRMKQRLGLVTGLALAACVALSGTASAAPAAQNGWGDGNWNWTGSTDGSYLTTPTGEMRKVNEKTVDLKGVEGLDITLDVADVQILPTKESKIKVVGYANWDMEEKEKPIISFSDATLQVKSGIWMSPWEKGWFEKSYRGSYRDNRSQKIEIYLPAEYRGQLQVDLDAANLNCPMALTLAKLKLGLDAADAQFLEITTENFDINVDASDLKIDKLTGTGKVNVDAADVDLNDVTVTKSLGISADAATVNCELAKGSAFRFDGTYNMGGIKGYFPMTEKGAGDWFSGGTCTATVGKGTATITAAVDCGELIFTEKQQPVFLRGDKGISR